MKKRKIYSNKFKAKACKLVTEGGMSRVAAAKKLGIGTPMLNRWIAKPATKAKTKTKAIKGTPLSVQLQTKIRQLQDEVEVLEKALRILH